MSKEHSKGAHGGAREGAGRPPIEDVSLVRLSVYVLPEQGEYVRERGDGNASAGLRAVLREIMAKE